MGRINRSLLAGRERDPKLALLRRIPMFRALSRADLDRVAAVLDEINLPQPGEVLMREGEANRTLFILTEGEAEVTLRGQSLRRQGPNDFLGLPSLLDDQQAAVTVTTTTPAKALVASTSQFATLRTIGDLELRMRSEIMGRLRRDFVAVAQPGDGPSGPARVA